MPGELGGDGRAEPAEEFDGELDGLEEGVPGGRPETTGIECALFLLVETLLAAAFIGLVGDLFPGSEDHFDSAKEVVSETNEMGLCGLGNGMGGPGLGFQELVLE